MLPWKLRKRQILLVNQNLSSVYFSPAKFQLVSCNPSLAMIWQMTYTHKLPKLCSATLRPVGTARKKKGRPDLLVNIILSPSQSARGMISKRFTLAIDY